MSEYGIEENDEIIFVIVEDGLWDRAVRDLTYKAKREEKIIIETYRAIITEPYMECVDGKQILLALVVTPGVSRER